MPTTKTMKACASRLIASLHVHAMTQVQRPGGHDSHSAMAPMAAAHSSAGSGSSAAE